MQDNINILNELKEAGSTVLVNADRKTHYSVPADYFNDFAGNLLFRIFIESIPPVNIYTVPSGYFENFPAIILEKVSIIEKEEFLNKAETMPYSVPEGYFDTLAKNILQKINAGAYNAVQQELEEIAPLLSKIPKTNVYSVPDGYFNQLDPLKIEIERPAAKVIPLGGRARKWVNYAAAACIAVLFGGGFLYLFRGPITIPDPLASVNIEKGVSTLSDDEISNYLKEDNSTAVYTNQNSDEQQKLDIKTLLENMSDEEIEQYLLNNADPGEVKKGI